MADLSLKKTIAEGKFLRFVNENGWEFVERINCTATVAIVAVTNESELLLTEQYRRPLGKKTIELPAGLVNDMEDQSSDPSSKTQHNKIIFPETIEEAAKRELLEETGYCAEEMIFLTAGPSSSGLTSELQTLLMAKGLKKFSEGGGIISENITVHKVSLNKIEEWLQGMQKQGYLVDPKIYAGMFFIKNQKKGIRFRKQP
jgi:ADP-ribose pyrophosphatase